MSFVDDHARQPEPVLCNWHLVHAGLKKPIDENDLITVPIIEPVSKAFAMALARYVGWNSNSVARDCLANRSGQAS